MDTYINLWDCTNYESGIIIYSDKSSLITNWAAFDVDGIPRLFAGTVIGLGEELRVLEKKDLSKNEIKDMIADVEDITLISDTDDEVNITSAGTVYKIDANGEVVTVITINNWH